MVNLNRMPGWEHDSWGYHGDDGKIFNCSCGIGIQYGPMFTTGDIIGCCLNLKNNMIFYTKNGVQLGIAFQDLKDFLYPCVGMFSQDGFIEVNFGHKKFKYAAMFGDDIDESFKEKWIKVINSYDDELINQKIDNSADLNQPLETKLNIAELEPCDIFALRYRGEIFHMMDRYEESLADLKKLLEINADYAWALKAIEEVTRKK
ncbi:1592_t:CDS:2 [Funneliformis caledonium]|uniref:1592_t:CDS:1 n=1 Tax=Funneliformis caledonium TaxID=1117310 RepID=A0A9N9DUW9_9GLOM|nr:1592_t:CDS:2 [Funneliformis caledonium]